VTAYNPDSPHDYNDEALRLLAAAYEAIGTGLERYRRTRDPDIIDKAVRLLTNIPDDALRCGTPEANAAD